MTQDEKYEIFQWIDSETDTDIPMETLLAQRNLTTSEALERANRFRDSFDSLCKSQGILSDEPMVICVDICKKMEEAKSDTLQYLCCCAITDRGLLLGQPADAEQKILQWLRQSEQVETLMVHIKQEPIYRKKLSRLKTAVRTQETTKETIQEEQALLYQMSIQHGFLYGSRNNNRYLANVGELVRIVNAISLANAVKPYLYSAVLSRKHKLMRERADYSPNLSAVLRYSAYNIDKDNGKNFNTYQSYLELYEQLQTFFADDENVDMDFSRYLFANLSNLSDWYAENCEPNEDIPLCIPKLAKTMAGTLFLAKNDVDLTDFIEENPVLELAFENVLQNEFDLRKAYANARYNAESTDIYAEQLCKLAEANRICKDDVRTKQYAACTLAENLAEQVQYMLIDALS